MKSVFVFSIIIFLSVGLHAQKDTHKTELNIAYYPTAMQEDEYLKERCKLDIQYPLHSKDFATVVWFHGGNLVEGEKFFPEELMHQNLCVVSANYRLSPKAKAPAYIQDAAAAVAWVFKNIEKYGGDPEKIFVSGHSAGGYLASMVGLDKQWLNANGIDANQIAGLIPFSGQTVTHTTVRDEQGIPSGQVIVDQYAPIRHVRKDAPPLLLITGDRNLEIPGRYEENFYLHRLMEIAGHEETRLYELQGYTHMMVYPALPLLINEIERLSKMKARNN